MRRFERVGDFGNDEFGELVAGSVQLNSKVTGCDFAARGLREAFRKRALSSSV